MIEKYCHEIYRNFDFKSESMEYFVSAHICDIDKVMKKILKNPEKIIAIDIGEGSKLGLIRAELNERLFLRLHESKYIIYDGPIFSRNFGKSYVVKGPVINPLWIKSKGLGQIRKNQAFVQISEIVLRGIAQNEIDLFFKSRVNELRKRYKSEVAKKFIENLASEYFE